MNILKAAEEVVFQRQGTYDKPENNFVRIADFWNTYFKSKGSEFRVDAKDVAIMMVLLKVAREAFQHKTDNLIDGCGYLQCLEHIYEEETKE